MPNTIVEIEVSIARNRRLYFPPLQRNIRGEFRLQRVADRGAMGYSDSIPDFPGQHIRVDVEKSEGAILEPIHKNAALVAFVANRNQKLAPEVQTFESINPQEWLFYIAQAVKLDKARIVSGTIPEVIHYSPPDNRLAPPPKRGEARKREIFRSHPETALEYLKMKPEQRAEWEALVGI